MAFLSNFPRFLKFYPKFLFIIVLYALWLTFGGAIVHYKENTSQTANTQPLDTSTRAESKLIENMLPDINVRLELLLTSR